MASERRFLFAVTFAALSLLAIGVGWWRLRLDSDWSISEANSLAGIGVTAVLGILTLTVLMEQQRTQKAQQELEQERHSSQLVVTAARSVWGPNTSQFLQLEVLNVGGRATGISYCEVTPVYRDRTAEGRTPSFCVPVSLHAVVPGGDEAVEFTSTSYHGHALQGFLERAEYVEVREVSVPPIQPGEARLVVLEERLNLHDTDTLGILRVRLDLVPVLGPKATVWLRPEDRPVPTGYLRMLVRLDERSASKPTADEVRDACNHGRDRLPPEDWKAMLQGS